MLLRVILISFIAAAFLCVAANRASAQPYNYAEYEVLTGRVTFRNLNRIYAMRLFSSSNGLIPGAGTDIGFPLTEETASLYAWLTFDPPVTSAALSPGIIAKPYLPPDDLHFDYTDGIGPIRSGPVNRIEVPEPSTIALSAVGLVGAVAVRRYWAGMEPVTFKPSRESRGVAWNRAAKKRRMRSVKKV